MEIKLKKLTLQNFKGIKSFELEADGDNISVYGQNKTGKTSLIDSFLWLLFDKNSEGMSVFSIKTLDKDNNPIHKLNHEVEAVLDVDGSEMTPKKIYKEKWVKKRGEEEAEFSGHETEYFWNEIPISQKDYKEKIDSLCDENIFKMITNPRFFNININWLDRRKILFDIVGGEVSDKQIAEGKKEFEDLMDQISGSSLEKFKDEIKKKIRKLKESLEEIPTRIDEIQRGMPEMPDVKKVEASIQEKEKELSSINDQLADISKANEAANTEKLLKQNKIYSLASKLNEIDNEIKTKYREEADRKSSEIDKIKNDIYVREKSIKQFEDNRAETLRLITRREEKITELERETENLRKAWYEVNESEIDFSSDSKLFVCPTCKRGLDQKDIDSKKEELTKNFNNDKVHKLEKIEIQGTALKTQIKEHQEKIKEFNTLVDEYDSQSEILSGELTELKQSLLKNNGKDLESIEVVLSKDKDYLATQAEIQKLEDELDKEQPLKSSEDLKEKSRSIQEDIKVLQANLFIRDRIESLQTRIKELESEAKTLGSEIAKLEKTEFTIEKFTRAKIDLVEDKINSKFKTVKWKLFNQLINGGIEESCECLIGGVPYIDANNASKINSGLEIIDTLCDHYQVRAPIFTDNAEAINSLNEINSQMIKLFVSDHKKLTVKSDKKLETVNA